MLFFILRVLILVLAFWVLWRLYVSWFGLRRPGGTRPSDDWTDVLESIKALPETHDPSSRAAGRRRPRWPDT
jgi:hypothetical protein